MVKEGCAGHGVLYWLNIVMFLVVLTMLGWGLVYQSGSPDIFGRYTYRYAALLAVLVLIAAGQLWIFCCASARTTGIAANLYTLLFSSLLVVLLTEALLRAVNPWGMDYLHNLPYHMEGMVKHPALGYVHPAGVSYSLGDVTVSLNSKGLRDEAIAYHKPAGERRIVALGDSVTFGWGVDQADVFAEKMETGLQAQTGHAWQVINAGVNGYNTEQERIWLEQEGLRYAPDIVILVYVRNDTKSASSHDARSRYPSVEWPVSLPGAIRWLRESSYLYQVTNLFARMQQSDPSAVPWSAHTGTDTITEREGWPASRHELERMAAMLRARGIPFLVARSSGTDPEFFRQIEVAGIDAITLDPAWLKVGAADAYVSRLDPHPAAAVHAEMARQLVHEIDQRGWLQD